jgi:metal-responsive CopG/Arc/MetJ family transcriptional regulator
MATVEKVTVSLPADLLARIKDRRGDHEISRSEVVSDLLWRGWRQVETEDREEQYRVAHRVQPETDEEWAWAEDAAAELLDEKNAD